MNENKLIAEFMEWDIDDPKTFPKPIQQPIYDGCWGDYRFQTSWDWLMPVVEKIECTSTDNKDNSDSFFNVMIEVFECNINGGNICICESGHNKREATYKAVVEFIKEYNK